MHKVLPIYLVIIYYVVTNAQDTTEIKTPSQDAIYTRPFILEVNKLSTSIGVTLKLTQITFLKTE